MIQQLVPFTVRLREPTGVDSHAEASWTGKKNALEGEWTVVGLTEAVYIGSEPETQTTRWSHREVKGRLAILARPGCLTQYYPVLWCEVVNVPLGVKDVSPNR